MSTTNTTIIFTICGMDSLVWPLWPFKTSALKHHEFTIHTVMSLSFACPVIRILILICYHSDWPCFTFNKLPIPLNKLSSCYLTVIAYIFYLAVISFELLKWSHLHERNAQWCTSVKLAIDIQFMWFSISTSRFNLYSSLFSEAAVRRRPDTLEGPGMIMKCEICGICGNPFYMFAV